MNGLGRKIFVCLADRQRSIQNVVRDDAVRDVHNGHIGIDAQDHALQNANEMIVRAVVCGECDDGPRQGCSRGSGRNASPCPLIEINQALRKCQSYPAVSAPSE